MKRKVGLSRRQLLASTGAIAASATLPRVAIGQGKRPLLMWIMDSANKDPMTGILNRFGEQTGIDVNLQVVPWSSVFTKWTTSFEAGTGADVSQCGGMGLFPAIHWDKGHLADLSDVLQDIGAENYFSSAWGRYDGAVTSIPWFLETRILWYRKDWLEEVGMAPPTNWDELVAVAKAMTRDGRYGLALPYQRQFQTGQNAFVSYINSDSDEPLTLAEQAADKGLSVTVDRDHFVEGLTFYTDLLLKHDVLAPGVTAGDTQSITRLFSLNVAGMVIGNGSVYSQIEQENPALISEGKIGAVLVPGKNGPAYSFLGGSGLWLNKQSSAPEEAKELLRFLARPESQIALASAGLLNQPSSKEAQKDPGLNDNPFFTTLAQQLDMTKAYLWKAGPQPKLASFYGNFVMEQPVLDVVVEKTSPSEAFDNLQGALERYLVA